MLLTSTKTTYKASDQVIEPKRRRFRAHKKGK